MGSLGPVSVGDEVRVKLRDGEQFVGHVFAFDKRYDTLVLGIYAFMRVVIVCLFFFVEETDKQE